MYARPSYRFTPVRIPSLPPLTIAQVQSLDTSLTLHLLTCTCVRRWWRPLRPSGPLAADRAGCRARQGALIRLGAGRGEGTGWGHGVRAWGEGTGWGHGVRALGVPGVWSGVHGAGATRRSPETGDRVRTLLTNERYTSDKSLWELWSHTDVNLSKGVMAYVGRYFTEWILGELTHNQFSNNWMHNSPGEVTI